MSKLLSPRESDPITVQGELPLLLEIPQADAAPGGDLPAFFGPVITGEQRQLQFVVRLRVLPGQREPALPASALRHPSQH